MPTHIKSTSAPNPQGVSRISLIDLAYFNTLDLRDLLLNLSPSELESLKDAFTFFSIPSGGGSWLCSTSVDTPGVSYFHTIDITVPASALDIHSWLRDNMSKKFAAYFVLNSGDVHLVGSVDQPCHLLASREVIGQNKYTLSFSCHCLDFPDPLYADSVPHFFPSV